MNTYVLLAAAVLAVLALSRVVKYLKGRRGRSLAEVAARASVELEEYGPELKLLEATGLPFFVDGRSAVGKFLFRLPEQDGAKSYYFDYSCLLGSGDGQRKRQATVALFDFSKGAFPDFHLSADGDIQEASGLEPVEMAPFKGLPPGVKLYGRDQAALLKLFTPEIAACFGEHPGWSAQGAGRYLVMYKGCSLLSPGKYGQFMAEAEKLAFNLA
ncbi:MAG: hypothetical protein HY550_00610 [Elusimicrobia bacterium]|nr:hypothetical protein [Elusimicrobiota bacterium]